MAFLPGVKLSTAQVVTRRIKDREGMQRPPEATAKLLIFVAKLEKRGLPFPPRPAIAAHLGISVPAIDVILSHRQATGDLIERIERVPGRVAQRPSTVRVRYFALGTAMRALIGSLV